MSEPYIGEIRLWAINFLPENWLACEGQSLTINDYGALFSLLGTTYGGDGRTSFALPDLRGRTVVGTGSTTYPRGQYAGADQQTMTTATMPSHTHELVGDDTNGAGMRGQGNFFARPVSVTTGDETALYIKDSQATTAGTILLNPDSIGETGGGEAYSTRQPYMALRYCIATTGLYPSRS